MGGLYVRPEDPGDIVPQHHVFLCFPESSDERAVGPDADFARVVPVS